MNEVFSRYSLTMPECTALIFRTFYDSCTFPAKITGYNWKAFAEKSITDERALMPYDPAVVLWCMLTAEPGASCKTSEIVNVLYCVQDQTTLMFAKAQSAPQRRFMYVWMLRFVTDFLVALSSAVASAAPRAVDFGKPLLQIRKADSNKLNKLSGKPYVDEFAYDTRNGTEAVAKITAATGEYTVKSFANIMNNLTPIMASLAHFNPNGADQERRTNDLLSKTRDYFDKKIASGELRGYAAVGAKALPESSKRFTEEQYEIKVANRKADLTAARYEGEHKRIAAIKNKAEREKETAALEERRKRELELEKKTFVEFSNVIHKSSIESVTTWMLRNKGSLSKMERKRDALYRNLFRYTPKHDYLFTMITRISMITELPSMAQGVVSSFSPLIQPIVRQIGRPELYILLSRILSKLPVQPDINTFITFSLNIVQDYVEPLKPFLPVFEHILRFTYPVWSRFYRYAMSFVTQTANFMFNKIFPALPNQHTITVATNAFTEVATGAIQLVGFVYRSLEMIGLGIAEMAMRVLWFIIKNFGVKIVGAVAVAL